MRLLKYLAVNSVLTYFLVNGIFNNVGWQLNIWKFLFWLTVVLTIFSISIDSLREGVIKRGPPISPNINLFLGVGIACFLASQGFYWYAGFCIFSYLLQSGIYTEKAKND